MIKAELRETVCGLIITVKGHAGYSKYGNDIVCAAVSSLILTLANHLESSKTAFIKVEKGYAELHSSKKEDYKLFLFVFKGIEMISRLYPKNVSVLMK